MAKASEFRDSMRDLLNNTVCSNVYLALRCQDNEVRVHAPNAIRVAASTSNIKWWLKLDCFLMATDDDLVAIKTSYWALCTGDDGEESVLAFDYERDKEYYSDAHIHIFTQDSRLREILQDSGLGKQTFEHLHLPVGGRRFRPTVEDLIEFLVAEKIATPHTGWNQEIESRREVFNETQLRAAIRRRLDVAISEVKELGYDVTKRFI